MRIKAWLFAAVLALPTACGGKKAPPPVTSTTVVMFLVDGMMGEAVDTAIAAGATNLAAVLAAGVRVETARSTSPAAIIQLPDGSQPWMRASSGNVAVHTGCHLFESRDMDDIFRATHAAGIRSVFAGGDVNYDVFTDADFHYGERMEDAAVVQRAIDHLRNDGVRLLRLHLQRIRDVYTGPADRRDPASPYIKHLVEIDGLLGQLVQALKDAGLWPTTYLIVAADHGMTQTAASAHPSPEPTSWQPFIAFQGPGLKKNETIPYAELPDLAVTAVHFFGLPPLRGHLDPKVTIPVRGPTGTVLTNLYEGAPRDLAHPRLVEACLARGPACMGDTDSFAGYRQVMLELIH